MISTEATVSIMSMAGRYPKVCVTLTSHLCKLLDAINTIEIRGDLKFADGIQTAQLILKHRWNKNHRQRIVVFLGSPVQEREVFFKKMHTRRVIITINFFLSNYFFDLTYPSRKYF